MKAILAMLLCAIISLSYAAQMDVKVPGLSSITETDVRNGGREVSLKLQGDAWQRNFALFAPFVWIGVTSGSGVNQEPYGFTANKGSVLPAASIVMDQRKNDGSTLALLLQPSPFYDIVYDEIIYIAVPSNATVSGVAPNTQAFVIKAARSSLNGPAIVTEAMLRAGGLNMTILLLNGETFVSRGVQRDLSVLETIAQVTSNLFDLPEETNNFEVRKGLILKPIGFDIISPFDTMTVTFAADPMYNFYSPTEIVNFSLPKMFITSGLRPTPLAPLGFVVQNSPGTVYFHETVASPTGTGTIVQIAPTPSLTETEIRSGTAELVLVVLHDIWALADNTSAAVINKKTIFLQGFRSSDANGKFNNRMGSGFLLKSSGVQLIDLVPNPVTSEMRLRVKFEKDPQFILPANTAREMVTFFIPGEMFVSGISPQAQGGGVNSFQFSIEAMGHIQEFAARSALPIHSGYISGIIQRPVNLQLVVQLTKDKWKEAACKDVLRFGFSSNLPNLPHGFMRKLDTIVSPFGAQFQKCGSGAAELCLLTLPISTVSSFSLVPDAANTYPEPEIVTFKVPARCVGFGIQPSGGATFVIDVVPTQISYIAYMPGVDAGRPALTGTVYADRVFQIEAVYANTTAWNGIKLVNSLKCTSPDATQIEHTSIQKCSESNSCQTDAKKSKNAHSIEFKPKSGAFTFAGVWSICVMYDTEPFQLGTHLVIDTDPSATAGSEAAAPATAVDPTIVAVCQKKQINYHLFESNTINLI